MKRVVVVRQDNNGDVLLTGPAVRAVAASGASVTMVCGPRGAAAANVLPGIECVVVFEAAWIDADPRPLDRAEVLEFLKCVWNGRFSEALVFTSFHQSPLPMALLLRLAGVPRIGAISTDYAGSLLDVRHHVDDDIHEVRRALSLASAMGYSLPEGDDARLQVASPSPSVLDCDLRDYVVVHPGATAAARTWSAEGFAATVELLARRGRQVVVTGAEAEKPLTQFVAGEWGIDAGGRTSFDEFLGVVRRADAIVCGNTAAAHAAAATGTPVVSIFPPTIPLVRFAPWMVRSIVLGDQHIGCAGCRARTCPHDDHPCLAPVTPRAVADAVDALTGIAVAAP